MPADADYVFGYGSLAGAARTGHIAVLSGYRRTWGVAMDNSLDIAGYKHYVTPDGERPPVRVAFLDLVEAPSSAVNGVCVPVVEGLEELDRRERNYVRRDVSGLVRGVGGRVWAYFGSAEGRRRRAEGQAVISREYLTAVEEGFRALGERQHREFTVTTDLDSLPVWDLIRVDHP